MIGFWNRREVYVGTSLDEFNNLRDLLSERNIKYKTRIVDRSSANAVGSSRARVGTTGQNLQIAYTYYVYVHRDDYQAASEITSNRIR